MTTYASTEPEVIAGGTDLMERRRSGIARGHATLLQPTSDSALLSWQPDGSVIIGRAVTVATLAADARIQAAYPGLAAAAGGLATPQIRNRATVGGNLAQRNRCWYFRSPHFDCPKKSGDTCCARAGNHLYGVIFDMGPCVAPHPSTLGVALVAYEARITTTLRREIAIEEIFGPGTDGRRDNSLQPEEIITSIALPPPLAGEQAAYRRCISRSHAEWPLVEAVVRIVRDGTVVSLARVAVGGVAPIPLRLSTVERALEGSRLDAPGITAASRLSGKGARPLPQTGYKILQLEALVYDLLEHLS